MAERGRRESVSPERWGVIEELFTKALSVEREQRAELLADACRDDDALLRDVGDLLDSHDVVVAADGTRNAFLETLDAERAAALVRVAEAMPLEIGRAHV